MAAAKKQAEILDPEKIISRTKKTERAHIDTLGKDIVVRKLPAMAFEDAPEGSSIFVIALVEGVAEPEMTEEVVRALDADEANEIYEAVAAFNPGVLAGQEEAAAQRRKSFPARS